MNYLKSIVGFAIAFAFSITLHAAGVEGIMMVVKGDIKVITPDGKSEAGKVGKKVTAGDTITAGADSRAKIVMADKNVINVSPDSKIVIEKYENNGKDKSVELNVVYGKVRASVEQKYDGDKNKFNIKTPSAVAGVRGTDFMMGYNQASKTAQIITFAGSVAVGQPGPGGVINNPVFVNAGQMTTASAGQAPSAPKAVPKEDLNKMNNESKADSTSNGKQDQNTADNNKDGDKKDKDKDKSDEKKDDKRDPASDEKKEEKKDDKKKEDKKDSDKKEETKKDEPKKDADKKDDKKGDKQASDNSGDKKGDSKGETKREPASTTAGGDTKAPEATSPSAPAPSPSGPAPDLGAAPPPPPPPPPPTPPTPA